MKESRRVRGSRVSEEPGGVWRGRRVRGVQGVCEEPGSVWAGPGAMSMMRALEHLSWGQVREFGLLSLEKRKLRNNIILVYKYQEKGATEMMQGSVWWWSVTRVRETAGTDAQEHSTWAWRTSPLCSDRAREQIVQGGCGVSVSGVIPEPSGHNPVPCASGWPCRSGKIGPDDPLWSLPARPSLVILWGGWRTGGCEGVRGLCEEAGVC